MLLFVLNVQCVDEAAAIERLDRLAAERTGADQNRARLERAKLHIKDLNPNFADHDRFIG